MYEKFGQFIDGKWQQSEKKETYEVINPANEEVLGHASKATPVDVEKALKSAEKGLEVWKKTSPWKRSSIIRKIADLIRENQDVLAKCYGSTTPLNVVQATLKALKEMESPKGVTQRIGKKWNK